MAAKPRIRSLYALTSCSTHYVTLGNVINKRLLIDGKGYTDVTIDPHVVTAVFDLVADIIGGVDGQQVSNASLYGWMQDRLYIVRRPDSYAVYAGYCAGQHYPSELRAIRKRIRETC